MGRVGVQECSGEMRVVEFEINNKEKRGVYIAGLGQQA